MKTVLPAIILALTALATVPALAKMPVCKGPVVYAVSSLKVYFVKGETWYGHAKGGTYMCQAAATAKGYKKQ